MKTRGFYALLLSAIMLVTALSISSVGAFLLGAGSLLALLISLLSLLLSMLTCRFTQALVCSEVSHGDTCTFTLRLHMFSPLPISPLILVMRQPSGRVNEYLLPTRLWGETLSENELSCPHVGVFPVGIMQVRFIDCFGFFSLTHRVHSTLPDVTVLPVPTTKTTPVTLGDGDGENVSVRRAWEDHATPADLRAWQEGDEMHSIHWKLSMRRQALMVHTYETPQQPDVLVLLNGGCIKSDQRSVLIDALCDTCAGVLKGLLDAGHPTRLSLLSLHPQELSGQSSESLTPMLRLLAAQPFTEAVDFTRALLLFSGHVGRTGACVILSTELTPPIAEAAISLSRMGPCTRFTLITSGGADKDQMQLLHLLLSSGLEATHMRTS